MGGTSCPYPAYGSRILEITLLTGTERKPRKMKFRPLLLVSLLIFASCTTYRDFDREKSFVMEIKDSSQVTIGPEKWTGPDDCSAVAYMNRTDEGLLLTIRVKDDSVRTGNEFSYMNDGVEIYMDLRPPRLYKRNAYEKGVFQAVVIPRPGEKNTAPIAWYPKNYNSQVNGARAWTQLFDSSYVVQVLFPYSSLKRNHFWPRTSFAMDISINDADSLNRETQMMWKGKVDDWNSPMNFERVVMRDEKADLQRTRRKKSGYPNMLLILTDQQTMKAMGAYGNPYVHTPFMDDLAAAGIRFTKSYCAAPASGPSKSAILTGLYPHLTGVNYNGQKPDSSILNMGSIFRKAGYRTIWGGKWDLPETFPHTSGIDSIPGFTLVDFAPPEKTTGRGSDTDVPLADAMAKTLLRHPDEPWLMVVSFQNPHDIVNLSSQPLAFLPAVNPEGTAPLPHNYANAGNEPGFINDCRKRTSYEPECFLSRNFTDEQWRDYQFQYFRKVESVDEQIGKIIEMLERQGYDENTLIVFTSDHGDGASAHKWAGCMSPYEETMAVPLIISWFGKNFPSNVEERHPVSGYDILPSMIDYAGLPIPDGLSGKSLKPLIEDPETPFREFIYGEIAPDPAHPERLARMVRYRDFKYILYSYGTPGEQLFDLGSDPGEMTDLAGTARFSEIKEFLKSSLNRHILESKDYFKAF
jgi:arylsulfatase A-like enzyme